MSTAERFRPKKKIAQVFFNIPDVGNCYFEESSGHPDPEFHRIVAATRSFFLAKQRQLRKMREREALKKNASR